MYIGSASKCEWDTDSYWHKGGIVPVKIFEDETVHIVSEYSYVLTGRVERSFEVGNLSTFSGFKKVVKSLQYLRSENYGYDYKGTGWELKFKNVNNDIELENFIKELLGSGCKLGKKSPSAQPGAFDISVLTDGKSWSDATTCPISAPLIIKYHPAKGKAVYWDFVQEMTFRNQNETINHDQEMADSFKFE